MNFDAIANYESNYESIDELREDFLLALSRPSVPDFYKVKPDHVFDENKSVRWNREEAIRVNNEYDAKCKILRAERDVEISLVIDRIKKYISINVGCSLLKELSEARETIFNYGREKAGRTDFIYKGRVVPAEEGTGGK